MNQKKNGKGKALKKKKNDKLGLLAEPPLTPPPLLTWAPLSGDIVVCEHFLAVLRPNNRLGP